MASLQYTQVGAFAPSHDRNGNLASMGGWVYRYDAMSRLIEATDGQTEARFRYDGKNRCVARSYRTLAPTGAALSQTLQLNTYDNWNLIEERDPSGAQQARYIHGRKIDEIIVMVNRHGTFYPHHDVLGNVMMLTGKDGRLVERYTYSVTGQVTISDATGKTLTGSAVGNRWMFTGREWLQEVALYDYRNRVYSAELGRFLRTDPIRFSAGDVNIYRYCENRLLFLKDPSGLDGYLLNDSDAVQGFGHSAILVDNPAGGWQYISTDGETYRLFGADRDVDINFPTLEAALNSPELARYDGKEWIETEAGREQAVLDTARAELAQEYSISEHNCADLTAKAFQAGGGDGVFVERTQSFYGTDPNAQFQKAKELNNE